MPYLAGAGSHRATPLALAQIAYGRGRRIQSAQASMRLTGWYVVSNLKFTAVTVTRAGALVAVIPGATERVIELRDISTFSDGAGPLDLQVSPLQVATCASQPCDCQTITNRRGGSVAPAPRAVVGKASSRRMMIHAPDHGMPRRDNRRHNITHEC